MNFKRLLAKSCEDADRPSGAQTLRGHTAMVFASAVALWQQVGEALLKNLQPADPASVKRVFLLSAFIHDFGKCSNHFQEMVRGKGTRQLLRHEAGNMFLLWPGRCLAPWLLTHFTPQELMQACVIASGHHRKFPEKAVAADDQGAGTSITLLTAHEDFRKLLEFGQKQFGLSPPPVMPNVVLKQTGRFRFDSFFNEMKEEIESWGEQESACVTMLKPLLVAADVAGSALVDKSSPNKWIKNQLQNRANQAQLNSIVSTRTQGAPLRPFQNEVGSARGPTTLVTAGCGTGKTVAAYAWAAQYESRQIWFCYPTTGTTSEGFTDYVVPADVDGRLVHGRAFVDLKMMTVQGYPEPEREAERVASLETWGAHTINCTVDTVLGLVQSQRKGMYAFPALLKSVLIFDEIHAYSPKMFELLLRLLTFLPEVPVLLMTASLPESRVRELKAVAKERGEALKTIQGPESLETLARYERCTVDPLTKAKEVLAAGGKVLWVSNTVNRAIEASKRLAPFGDVVTYHSRFKYIDRVARHREAVDSFKTSGAAAICATQVAEMSLDLSADLLISDLAPIPSLIQRLGRLNRRANPDEPPNTMPFIVVTPEHELPYEKADLADARAWLDHLPAAVSQRDLVDCWDHSSATTRTNEHVALDDVFNTKPLPVREAAHGCSVLLESDVPGVKARRFHIQEVLLPMPMPPRRNGFSLGTARRFKYQPVVPDNLIEYSELRGARWVK